MGTPALKAALAAVMVMSASGPASAQEYPMKPVRLVTSAAGGGGDILTRLLAQALTGPMGQSMIVDNRGGILAFEAVAKAAPDGYTLLSSPNNFWLLPFMQNVSYDPIRDFVPITLYVRSPNVIVVHPSLPVKSIKELVALAKAKPGQLNFAAGSTGSSSHLAAELFKITAGANIVHIAYKGAAAALNDTIAGNVFLLFSNTAAVAPHAKSGRLRSLAVTSAQPSALAPDLPTVAGSGYPGYEAAAMYGLFAPAGSPAAAINRLNQETLRALVRSDVKERFFNAGVETVGTTPDQLFAAIKSEMTRLGKVIKDAGIRGE
jgi:tripartite-type tricarboxylate transporter receptor subunit TctC